MIAGHTPYCTLDVCYCSPSDELFTGGAFRRLGEEAAREKQTSDWLWAMLRPRIETLITEILIELEATKHGNSQGNCSTDCFESRPVAEEVAAAELAGDAQGAGRIAVAGDAHEAEPHQ